LVFLDQVAAAAVVVAVTVGFVGAVVGAAQPALLLLVAVLASERRPMAVPALVPGRGARAVAVLPT